MTKLAKVKNEPGLVRDLKTGAITATPDELTKYRTTKARMLKEKERDRKIQCLTSEVNDLKALVRELIERIQPND
jgi:hypothetical protein